MTKKMHGTRMGFAAWESWKYSTIVGPMLWKRIVGLGDAFDWSAMNDRRD